MPRRPHGTGLPGTVNIAAQIVGLPGSNFSAAHLSLGVPVDPFAASMTVQAQERQRREQGERDAAELRRTALLSQIGQVFS